jgi:hypothetical protein
MSARGTRPIGCTRWAIPEGYIPSWSHGPEPEMKSHETVFTQVRALLMEVKPYVLLLLILMEMYRVQT